MKWLKPHEVVEPGWYACDYFESGDAFGPICAEVYVNDLGQVRIKSTNDLRPQVAHLNPLYRLFGPIPQPTE